MLEGWRRSDETVDVAVDVGTGTTRLTYGRRMGMLERPSVITAAEAIRRRTLSGLERMRAPQAVPALRAGVVVDAEAAAVVLSTLLRRARRLSLHRPRVLAFTPTDASEAEQGALVEAIRIAGARAVRLAPEPLAAAIGTGIDLTASDARMVIDIGEGVTDVAVIRRGRLVHTAAVRTACADLHGAIRDMIRLRYAGEVSLAACARLTRIVGAQYPHALPSHLCVPVGNDEPQSTIAVSRRDLWSAVDPVYERIVGHVADALRALPEACHRQIAADGLRLTGGGALVRGLGDRIRTATRVPVRGADYPLHAVISGAAWLMAKGSAAAALLPARSA